MPLEIIPLCTAKYLSAVSEVLLEQLFYTAEVGQEWTPGEDLPCFGLEVKLDVRSPRDAFALACECFRAGSKAVCLIVFVIKSN